MGHTATTSGSDIWIKVFDGVSGGTTDGIEYYDISDTDSQQVRIKVFENSAGRIWTNITEVDIK